jgi:hypothetical protein
MWSQFNVEDQPFRFLAELVDRFEAHCPEDLANVLPCSQADISRLEEKLDSKLPAAYREFLLWVGRGGGLFLQKQYRYDVLGEINSAARKILEAKLPDVKWPSKALVIALDMDESFYFISSNEGDDPRVFIFMDEAQKDYMRNHPARKNLAAQWNFLSEGPGEAFGIFSPTLSSCLSDWLDVYIAAKRGSGAIIDGA